jgi:LysM repeat protein
MTARLRSAARGFIALLALLLLVVGVPAFLTVAIGWPLPRGAISPSDVLDAIRGSTPIDDAVWLNALACIAWLMWVRVTVAVLGETVAAVNGRPPGDQGVRRAIAPLVAAIVLMVSTTQRVESASSMPLPARPLPAAAAPLTNSQRTTPTSVATTAPTWTVARNDTLWDIAQHTLGDPMRWRDIFDLNQGRAQPDGSVLTDAGILQAGWILQLPAEAQAAATQDNGSVEVRPGDTLSGIAAEQLGDPDRYLEIFELNAGRVQLDGAELHDPDLIRPDWTLKLPISSLVVAPVAPAPTPPGVLPADPGDTSSTPNASPESAEPARDELPTRSTDRRHHDEPVEFGLLAAGLLAASAVGGVAATRRLQRRRRAPSAPVPTPPANQVSTEARLRRAAANAQPSRLRDALSAVLRVSSVAESMELASVSHDGEIELLFAQPVGKAPSPWHADTSGRLWTLPSDAAVCPTRDGLTAGVFGTIGVTADREVLVDFSTPACTTISGDEDEATALLAAICLGLIGSELLDDIDVAVVGDAVRSQLDGCERVRRFADLEEAESVLGRMADANASEPIEGGGSMTPTVVLADARQMDEATAARLGALLGPGVSLVMVGEPGRAGVSERNLVADRGTVRIEPLGITVSAVTTPDEAQQMCALLEVSPAAEDSECCDTDVGDEVIDLREPAEADAETEVLISILGPVEVTGAAGPFSRRIAEEVAVYLALHPRGVDEGRLKAALWPDRSPATNSFNQAVSRARVALGVSAAGEHHLRYAKLDGLYKLGSSVTTDVARLEMRLRVAKADANEDAARALAELIDDVQGLPFAGTATGYEWAYAEGLVAWAQGLVSDAAHLVAGWALENADPALALQVTRSALLACPADEILYRDQMRAHDLAGNPAGVDAAMRELLAVIEAEVPQDAVHPETLALYEELCPRARRSSAPVK